MSKTTDSGKTEGFKNLFNRVIQNRSHKTLKTHLLNFPDFQSYLETAQKHFGFTFTEETLDDFIRGWMVEAERYALEGTITEQQQDKLREWADYELGKLGMKAQDNDTYKALELLSDIMLESKKEEYEITTPDGKVHKGFKWYDSSKPVKTETANKTDEQVETEKNSIRFESQRLDNDDPNNVNDFKLMEFTKNFCRLSGNFGVKQFEVKAETFRRRLDLIETAKRYRFGDSFLPLLVYHNKNEYGYRRMPRDNMWIEVGLKLDNVFISGIHLAKVFVDTKDSGFGSKSFRYCEDIIPSSYTDVGISVFVVGIENEETMFYYHFILEKSDIEAEKLKGRRAYACPYCSMPMDKLQGKNYFCGNDSCVKAFQEGVPIVYNLDDPKTKDQLRLFEMKSIWKSEDKIRKFTTNLLDFLTNKRVVIVNNMSEADLEKQNQKRAKRGKSALFPVNIIKVDGTLKEYVSFIKKRFKGNYKLARRETPVDGHFYRFKNRNVWTRLYGWIKGIKEDDKIQEKLSQLKRVDENGMTLPDEEQYEWDGFYKHIKVWKLPFYRFKGEGDPRPRIDIIQTGENQ